MPEHMFDYSCAVQGRPIRGDQAMNAKHARARAVDEALRHSVADNAGAANSVIGAYRHSASELAKRAESLRETASAADRTRSYPAIASLENLAVQLWTLADRLNAHSKAVERSTRRLGHHGPKAAAQAA